ncbi:matrixin family metalloprotease [Nakamurella leprariae]|uniref:matrixin family metalloprotease n=1 Tax=Nakamurella leprariae TaxID=2803911 RepID=UPI001962D9C5|nr:matrixin family metalloprotease [Nakamurella leprariae]
MSGPGGLGRRVTGALSGLTRALTHTSAALAADLGSALARAGEAVGELAGRDREPGVLRLRVLILSDERGRPLTSEAKVRPALDRAETVLRAEAGIRTRVLSVDTITEPAPAEALDPHANRRLLLDDVLLGRTAWYHRHLDEYADPDTVGAPVTVIVVRQITGRTTGCSLGVNADWVIVQASLFDRARDHTYDETVLVHELGHALNLPHTRDRENLMFPSSSPPRDVRGTRLQRWQAAVVQSNRHVVPGRPVRG